MPILLVSCAFLAAAQTQPSVTGTWKMNLEKSKFANNQHPTSMTVRFEQTGPVLREWLTFETPKGEANFNCTYTLDGKEGQNLVEGEKIKTTAKWEANVLLIEWKYEGGASARRFTPSEDGKSLTVEARNSDSTGERTNLIVLEKQ